jgi:hypothetical protein
MILAFKPQFPAAILAGTKIHSMRTDAHNRWHAGNSIQMATGVRTKAYHQFNAQHPHLQQCISTQQVTITYHKHGNISGPSVQVNGRQLNALEVHDLAINDGFPNIIQFFDWFNTNYTGKIIHWTGKRY